MELEVIPAILVKDRAELLRRIAAVSSYVKTVHIDVMDDKFVPNKTIGPESFSELPKDVEYEFHWMVEKPEEYIVKVPGPHIHLVHIETVKDWSVVEDAIKKSGGKLGIAFNPATPNPHVLIAIEKAHRVLAMTVVPGFSGQKYIKEVEDKITELRTLNPKLDIEVDGGIGMDTVNRAVKAGANKLAASSAIFKAENKKKAIEDILEKARGK
jgi:ribulose-phosphate 3-epimerase